MTIRSYVDLCLFVRFVHVRREQIPSDVMETLLQVSQTDVKALSSAWVNQMAATTRVSFHETYHYWQGLRLPFLHRYAILSFLEVYQAFKALSQRVPDLHDWDIGLPQLERLVLQDKLWQIADDEFIWGRIGAELKGVTSKPLLLSPLDLLEGATSLAEFQVHSNIADQVNPKAFSRWAKRHPTYKEAYDFTALVLRNEVLALQCFIPIVNAAFHTTEPVRAFCLILTRIAAHIDILNPLLEEPEPLDWEAICHQLLDTIEFEAGSDSDGRILGSPFHRLTLRPWVFNVTIEHPFLTRHAREWCSMEDTDPVYSWLLSRPGWAGEKVLELMRDFAPTLSFIRFHIDGQRDRVISTGTLPENIPIVDLLTMYSVVRRASGSHFVPESRLCHHTECPEYAPNYCNCFPKIPADYRSCEFLQRVERVRQHVDT